MPPLPPNLSRANIISKAPSWGQKTMARRDNVTRFITRRFPAEPSGDTNWVNPSLPPGASRLAIPVGHSGTHNPRPIFPRLEWELVGELPINPDQGNSVPMSLALSVNTNVIAVGYPGEESGDTGLVRVYKFDEATKRFVQKGQDLTYTDTNYGGGTSVALTDTGSNLLVGIPTQRRGDNNADGAAIAYESKPSAWDRVGPEMYYVPLRPDEFYGTSVSFSSYATTTERWYSTAGAPGGDTIYINSHNANVSWNNDIGRNDMGYNEELVGPTSSRFGASSDISNPFGSTSLHVVVGAPGTSPTDASFFRIIKGNENGVKDNGQDEVWAWTTIYDSSDEENIGTVNGQLGASVAIVADGTLVVAGDPANAVVYVLSSADGGGTWKMLGPSIKGQSSSTRFGQSVGVDRSASGGSVDGTTIVIGEPDYDAPGRPAAGRVLVLEYLQASGTWIPVMNSVVGLSEYESFGETVAMVASDGFAAAGNRDSGRVAMYTSSGNLS